ncbi:MULTISPECIES: GNAT family N-acetyltransferase [unclassified Haladaptatus]|uniref:GNAT family N-acetyltransferase n=1 Tax=unclassified Haladaptatus TaxID=2622732 RepID=UPI00209C2C15|nr:MULTISPECIES: GNAT family N-acetyltransferase [unclassified Haladaptatus]MCO8244677.1 GNAT family N-acetyltransferase [Haladaptatus sp. AB643]MCO8253701.1 GNAT family N-acetyltransferase [Haladaptatus sp. AB618]
MCEEVTIVRTDIDGYEDELRELLLDYFASADEQGREWFDDDDFGADAERLVADDIGRLESTTLTEPLFLALDDGRIVGSVQLKRLDETTAEVKRLYVKPADRGKGIGRRLVDEVLTEAVSDGFETLRLGVAPFHERAQSLYRDLGFEFTEPYGKSQTPAEIRDDWNFMALSIVD